jgi:uncharacterized membrane protein
MTTRLRLLWSITLLLIVAAALRIIRINEQGFWFDELFSVYFARFDLGLMYKGIALEGTKLPLYYTLIHFLLPPNNIELTLRLISAAFGLLCIPVTFVVVRALLNESIAWWTALLLTVDPFYVHYSREARPYTLLLLAALVAMLAFANLIRRNNRQWWIVLVVAHMGLFITNLFALFIPFVQFLYIVFNLKRASRLLIPWMVANAIAIIPLAVWYGYMFVAREGQLRLAASWFPLTTPADLFYTFWNFTLGFLPDLTLPLAVMLIALIALTVLGIRYGNQFPRHRFSLFLLWITPVLFVWLIGLRRPLYGDRYLIVAVPPLLTLIAAGLLSLDSILLRRLAQVAVVIAMLWGTWQIYDNPENHREEWREAAQLITANQQPTDAIYTSELNAAISLAYYYHGTAPIRPASDLPTGGIPADLGTTAPYHFWLVIGYAEFSPHRLGQPYRLDWNANRAAIEKQFSIPPNATVLRIQPYAGLSVIEYEVK